MKLVRVFFVVFFSVISLICVSGANAIMLDFEDLPDLTLVNEFYASEGVHFTEAISLTAGFSLNEYDFPPSSGSIAIGDDWGPIEITFDQAAENIFANFTYGSELTIYAYDSSDTLIGSVTSLSSENYGSSELISLGFTGVLRLVIEGDSLGESFIMDDFNFELSSTPVPEPATMTLLGAGLVGLLVSSRKKWKK